MVKQLLFIASFFSCVFVYSDAKEFVIPLRLILSAHVVKKKRSARNLLRVRRVFFRFSFFKKWRFSDVEDDLAVQINFAYRLKSTKWKYRHVLLEGRTSDEREQLCDQLNELLSRMAYYGTAWDGS